MLALLEFGILGGGGKHQRFTELRAQSSAPEADVGGLLEGDAELELLIELWALGLMAATALQMIAAAALQAKPRAPMSALASVGATGGNLENVLTSSANSTHKTRNVNASIRAHNSSPTLDGRRPIYI